MTLRLISQYASLRRRSTQRRSPSLWWYQNRRYRNFGDELSPLVMEMILSRRVRRAPLHDADAIAIGSILGRVPDVERRKPLAIFGAGFMFDDQQLRETAPVIPILIRGEFSSERVHVTPQPVGLGDPGLLAGDLMLRKRRARSGVLLIPHFVDAESRMVDAIATRRRARVADVLRPPMEVLGMIATSDIVISSSLHGLVCADALGIPAVRVVLSDKVKGGDFKFLDYASTLHRSVEPVPLAALTDPAVTTSHIVSLAEAASPSSNAVSKVKSAIWHAGESLADCIGR